MYTLVNPFYYINMGFKGVKIIWACFCNVYGHDIGNELSQNTQETVFLKLSGVALDNPTDDLNSFRMQCMEYISKCIRIMRTVMN